jgi:hypothetical protein
MSHRQIQTQSTRFGELEVGVRPNGTDLARCAPLTSDAKRVMAVRPVVDPATGNYDAMYHNVPAVKRDDAAETALDALRRVCILRHNCVASHNAVAAALERIVEKMMSRGPVTAADHALLDEMHALHGAAHREGLKKAGAGAAAGNLYNSVSDCFTSTSHAPNTREKKRKKKLMMMMNFFSFFFFLQLSLVAFREWRGSNNSQTGLLAEVAEVVAPLVGVTCDAQLLTQFAR